MHDDFVHCHSLHGIITIILYYYKYNNINIIIVIVIISDIDECKQVPSLCHKSAVCINTNGSFFCKYEEEVFSGSESTSKLYNNIIILYIVTVNLHFF